MTTRIVSAFPGIGKTYFCMHTDKKCLDSDSSGYSWLVDEDGNKTRNPDFPANYIAHIKENIGKVDYIFVSTHKEVREALRDNCMYFHLVYPQNFKFVKEEMFYRYLQRGSPKAFIDMMDKKYDDFLAECAACDYAGKKHAVQIGVSNKNPISVLISNGEL